MNLDRPPDSGASPSVPCIVTTLTRARSQGHQEGSVENAVQALEETFGGTSVPQGTFFLPQLGELACEWRESQIPQPLSWGSCPSLRLI